MSVVVRLAGLADLDGLLKLYKYLNPTDPVLNADRAKAIWNRVISAGAPEIFVVERDDALVSSCTLSIIANLTRGGRPYGLIENVVTHADHRRRGLGRLVLERALTAAWRADCYKVTLATGSKRPETLRFYENVGFRAGGKTYFQASPPAG